MPIKFHFLLLFKIVLRSRWIANNTGWHPKTLCCTGHVDATGRASNDTTQTCELSAALCVLTFALRRLESMQALVAGALQASSDLIPVGNPTNLIAVSGCGTTRVTEAFNCGANGCLPWLILTSFLIQRPRHWSNGHAASDAAGL